MAVNITVGDVLIYAITYFGIYSYFLFLITLFENRDTIKSSNYKEGEFPSVSVIVPAYNEEGTISRTVESLLNLDYPERELNIVVVDDGSEDNTLAEAKKFESEGVTVFTKENGGKHTALNYALKRTDSEFVGALDADSVVAEDSLKKIISRFYKKEVMAVTPSMKIEKPKGILRKVQYVEFLIGIFLRKVFTDLGSQHVTPGPFTIYRREFFNSHGLYREAYMTEDIEMALRIQSEDYVIENSTDAYVYTHGPPTFKGLYNQRVRWYKGFLSNVLDYKELFSPKHGNLGLFILPGSFLSIILIILSMFYFFIKTGVEWFRRISRWIAIEFDLWNVINLRFDAFFINTKPVFILSVIATVIGVLIIYLAKRMGEEKKSIVSSYICFFFLYWILFGFWWLAAGYKKVRGEKTKWGHKSKV